VGAVTSYTFTNVTASHTIAASFAIDTHTIAATADANGSISPAGNVTVIHGSNQTFNITAAATYHVADVLVDGASVGAVTSYTFTNVTANHTISVSFGKNNPWEHIISAAAGPNGSISPSGLVLVNHGSGLTFTITPNNNYNIKSVLVDGASVGPVSSYTFNNVAGDHSIMANFVAKTISILTDKDKVEVPPGQTAPLKVKLSDEPPGNVVVTAAYKSGSPALSIKGTATLTFTPSNWDTYQAIQIAATPDRNDMDATAEFDLSGPELTGKQITAVKGKTGVSIGSIINLLLED